MNMIDSWKINSCDQVFTVQRMARVPVTKCSKGNLNESLPLIAVMAATTTRKVCLSHFVWSLFSLILKYTFP